MDPMLSLLGALYGIAIALLLDYIPRVIYAGRDQR